MRPLTRLDDLPTVVGAAPTVLGRRDAHVWRDVPAHNGPSTTSNLLSLLSPDEHGRLATMRDSHRREQFVRGRALCRLVLSRYAPVAPETWRFRLGDRGKPAIASPRLSSPLWFSLSHSGAVSVCAVTAAGPAIGIDIERIGIGDEALPVAEQFFSEAEVEMLRGLTAAQRGEAFIRLWTLKESVAKAREVSLADELGATSFNITRPDDVTVQGLRAGRGRRWRFRLYTLDSAHVLALAVRTRGVGQFTVLTGTWADLESALVAAGAGDGPAHADPGADARGVGP